MAIKKYKCRVNWFLGCEFFDVTVKSNSKRKAKIKAKIKAKEKVAKERGDGFCEICSCEEIKEDLFMSRNTDYSFLFQSMFEGKKTASTNITGSFQLSHINSSSVQAQLKAAEK